MSAVASSRIGVTAFSDDTDAPFRCISLFRTGKGGGVRCGGAGDREPRRHQGRHVPGESGGDARGARRARSPARHRQQRWRRQVRRPPPGPRQAARAANGSSCWSIPTAPFLELSPLAAWGTDYPVGGGLVTGIGVVEGVECVITGNDPTVRGGTSTTATVRKGLRALEIARENRLPLVQLIESGGADLPHQAEIFVPGGATFRDLTAPVGRRHPDDHARVRHLDRRRRLRPGHERLRRDDRPALEGVPRRPAAGEDGHRRGERRRGARRRRDARPVSRPRRLPRRRRARRPAHRPRDRAPPQLAQARARRRAAPAARRSTTPTSCSASRRPTCACRSTCARCSPGSSTAASFDEFKPLYGATLVTGWAEIHGYPVGILANQRRPVHRGVAEGRAVHPALQPDRHAAAVPAEHHRLHGRQGLRAARHHQARLEDDQRRLELARSRTSR